MIIHSFVRSFVRSFIRSFIHSFVRSFVRSFVHSSDSHLNVLDLTLHLVDGCIQTDVYSKPTDSHLYLKPTSAHPKHVFKAIPYGVATRLKRNCSNDEYLTPRLEEYKGYLIKQGYCGVIEQTEPTLITSNDLYTVDADIHIC